MGHAFESFIEGARRVLTDRLLQLLLLGVIGAAFFFALVLGADASLVLGVLAMGGGAACLESAQHRSRKDKKQ
jgi:hypothetical protein